MSGTEDADRLHAMTLTEAVRAVNEAGFTLTVRGHQLPGAVGHFSAGKLYRGSLINAAGYHVFDNPVTWERYKLYDVDGYVVRGFGDYAVGGVMTTPEEVKEALSGLDPDPPRREYVDIEQRERCFPKDVECPACEAKAGEPCTPIGTGYNRFPHGKRQDKARNQTRRDHHERRP